MISKLKATLASFLPQWLKAFVRRRMDFQEYDIEIRRKQNPFYGQPDSCLYDGSKHKIGIIVDPNQYHKYYIAACRDIGVSYQLIDLLKSSWVADIRQSGCDGYLVWPSILSSPVKQAFDERLSTLVNSLNKIIFPSLDESLIYENKKRMAYWLESNDIPHPQTWVFYDKREALSFMKQQNKFPIVFKTSFGAAASGVVIVRSKRKMRKLINQTFGEGFLAKRQSKYDKQRGFLIFQSFLQSFDEWRMVRIDKSFFGYKKVKVGDFHSGSHVISYEPPPAELLDFTRMVTNKGNFRSMGLDVFVDERGHFFVNELQTVFGTTALTAEIDRKQEIKLGRYEYRQGQWVFEPGDFLVNGFANLRVEALIYQIENQKTQS